MLATVGNPVPDTPHAVSVSLPSWKAVVGYEEGQEWVVSKMKTGYPRFFIHLTIQELEKEILRRYGRHGEAIMLFPSHGTAKRCEQFFYDKIEGLPTGIVHVLHFEPTVNRSRSTKHEVALSQLHCVLFPKTYFSTAKQVWQHSGDGISSRRGEFCLGLLRDGLLQPVAERPNSRQDGIFTKGPRRYQRGGSQSNMVHSIPGPSKLSHNDQTNGMEEDKDFSQFIEERFGRNLNAELAAKAKVAIRRRISGCLEDNSELDQALESAPASSDSRLKGLTEEQVYLYPCGMSSIFNTHRILLANTQQRGQEPLKSICFGFPYIDTLKILQKWGPGCLFYGDGSAQDIDDLERRLEAGERYLALFTEFPSNPLLNSPDLLRLRALADKYNFAIVVDETVGNFINISVLSLADVVVSSLTKVFSGDSNVMGGSCILNPESKWYAEIKETLNVEYEDNYWAEDAVFMERNSRDFISRIDRTNTNAEAIVSALQESPLIKQVYYPSVRPESKKNYDACRNQTGGYGGLLSVTFKHPEQAVAFFDTLEVEKG